MTGVVPNDLAHSSLTKYKDEPGDNPVRFCFLFALLL